MAEALAAKNAEIEGLVSSTDALKKQAALSEGNLASLQVHFKLPILGLCGLTCAVTPLVSVFISGIIGVSLIYSYDFTLKV